MNDIIGHGGGKNGGSSHTHYEATDSLHSTAYARVLDLVSEGEILGLANGVQSVFLNQTPVQNADGTSNFKGVTIDFRPGTQDQDYIPGFPEVENEISVNTELKSGAPWVHAINNTALSAIRITLGVPALSKADTSNGDILGYQVAYQVELATDGGAYAVVLSNAFNGKTTSLYERTARIDLPHATSGWQVRVTRLTANANTVGISDTTTIVSYTEVIDAKLRYPMSALVGVQVDATQFQAVPTRAYDLFGRIIQVPTNYDPVARTYSGAWDGTFKPAWSSNPAWVFRDLILNDRYGLGDRLTASQVDKWALYKIAQYCDQLVPDGKGGQEPRFTCNLYLQTQKQAYAVLQDIASIFRGISYWNAGTITASADMPSDPVYIYTAANVIGGKFARTGSKASTRYTVALVTWNDPADFYAQKTEYVEDAEGIKRYGIKQVQLTGFGCTSQGQAHRAGLWALATSRLETEGISFDVGMDGAIALPGQVVRVADPSRMGRRMGGRIRAVSGRALTLDKAPVVNAGDKLTVILPAGATETHTVASVAGDTVTVDADWSTPPRAQAVWSIDSSELSAPLFRILSVAPKDSSTFTITAVQHEPGKYDYVERGIAITPHSQTSLDVTTQAPPASVTLVGYTVSLNDVQRLALQVSCAPVPGAVAYEGAYRRGNDNWIAIPRQPSATLNVLDVLAGTYVAKMAAVNSIGITSIETMSVAVAIDKDGGSKNADILLQADAPYFHTNQAGQTDPSMITIAPTLIALAGAVSWSCVGGKLTNTSDTGAQLAFTDMTAASATVTASVTMFGRTYSKSLKVGKVQDGAAGQDGLKTAIARLFQWAPVAPAKPTGKSTFTWPGTNSGYDGTDGWANPAPGNPGTPGWRLFSASVGLQAALAATTTSVSYGNAVIEDGAQNGATGADGLKARPVMVYQWAASIPAGPTGPATLKWLDGTFGAAPTNWTLAPGAAPSLGMTLFAATVQIVDTASKVTTDFNWQSASVMAIGYVGTDGGKGAQGASYVTAYCATTVGTGTSAPAATKGKTSLPAANSGGLTGTYSASVPTLSAGQYQMQTDGIYDPTTDLITWSIPYQSSLKVATLSAITANLGAIKGGSIDIGTDATSWHIDASGNQWAGAATYGAAPYRVSNTGIMWAQGATLKNVTVLADDGSVLFKTSQPLAQQVASNPNLCPTPIGMLMYGGATGNRNGDVRFGDGQYVYIPPTGDSSYCGANSGPLRIPVNAYYTVSFDVYCNSNSGRALNVDVAGTGVDSNGISLVPTTTMTRYKFSEQMPAGTNGDASLRMFTVAPGGDVFIISNIKVELGNTMTPWCDSVITKANASTYIQYASLDIAYIDKATIADLSALNAYTGTLHVGGGGICVGDYTGYSWVGAGQSGAYFGSGGALFGTPNNGRYFQITSDGNLYAPYFSIVNGNATFSGTLSAASGSFSGTLTAARVVTTDNMQDNSISSVDFFSGVSSSGSAFAVARDNTKVLITGTAGGPGTVGFYVDWLFNGSTWVQVEDCTFFTESSGSIPLAYGFNIEHAGTYRIRAYPSTGVGNVNILKFLK